jgi:uncharacterized protein YkwD
MIALLLSVLALGAAPARYNDPVGAPARSPLVIHVEELVRKLAPITPTMTPTLTIDPRLERAAVEIARRAPSVGPPPNELVEAALWLQGLVEPPPHLVVVTMSAGADDGPLLDELRASLPRVIQSGKYRRLGVAAETVAEKTNVVVALQESFVELEPVPRALPAGGGVLLKGRILAPYARPEVLVTAPDGQVTQLFTSARDDVKQFTASLHCLAVGRHQVEVTGDDRFGPAVLANFPVDCGLPAPTELVAGQRTEREGGVKDAAQAEAELLKLLNADRARAGLRPLSPDARLSQVARAHSEDMVRHHFVGHVSPSTGSAADRLRAASVPAQLILENVARAYSPGEVERGLMESPGHRANVLNREVTQVGVGVALGDAESGVREIFATQLFLRAPEALPGESVAAWQAELKRLIAQLRRGRDLTPLVEDGRLDQIAASTAAELAKKKSSSGAAQELLTHALGGGDFGNRYRAVKSGVAIAPDLPQALESLEKPLADPGAAGVGVGVARGNTKGNNAQGDEVYVVILVGKR